MFSFSWLDFPPDVLPEMIVQILFQRPVLHGLAEALERTTRTQVWACVAHRGRPSPITESPVPRTGADHLRGKMETGLSKEGTHDSRAVSLVNKFEEAWYRHRPVKIGGCEAWKCRGKA